MTVIIQKSNKPLPKRHALDVYLTPRWAVESALRCLPTRFKPAGILDPCAGEGVWGKAARIKWPDASIVGYDIRDIPDSLAYNNWYSEHDFLLEIPLPVCDLVLCNPPYSDSEAFIRHSLKFVRQGGYALFLLRLAFLGGQDRAKSLFKRIPPKTVVVQSSRIPFAGDSPHETHCYIIWQKGYSSETTLKWTWVK